MSEPLWGRFVNRSLLQVKLNDVCERLNVEEIASRFHFDRDDAMATLFELGGGRHVGTVFSRSLEFGGPA